LRTIIALAQSSHTLADGLETNGSYDDLRNMNTQINELILFVGRHPALMDTVTTAARMRSVVQAGKLAVIIGIEMDNIGNFYNPNERRSGEVYNPAPTAADVKTEIDRLYNLGVRYVLPIHVINNVFGGSAVYGEGIESLVFNISNYYDTNNRFDVENVSTVSTGIGFRLPNLDFLLKNNLIKDVINVIRSLPVMPLKPDVLDISRYSYPDTARNYGHINKMGLSALGIMAVKYMMSKGIMIDVDHMSQRAVTQTMQFGTEFNYPINSGHNGPRGVSGSEKTRTDGDYATIARLGGMVGVGTGDTDPAAFVNTFGTVFNKVGGKNLTIGTDVGVGAKLPKAPAGRGILRGNVPGLEPCHTGNKTWDYNTYNSEGVDHYGMMPEFIKSLDEAGMSSVVKNELFSSAEYFAGMWEKCERNKVNVH
jgi:microsomal dipeptidase-like Zn-dependent dipeptidase